MGSHNCRPDDKSSHPISSKESYALARAICHYKIGWQLRQLKLCWQLARSTPQLCRCPSEQLKVKSCCKTSRQNTLILRNFLTRASCQWQRGTHQLLSRSKLVSDPNEVATHSSATLAPFALYTSFKMIGLLSLPEEVVELVGRQIIRQHGLRAWCRVTSTCKRLWGMQLPGSASSWSVISDDDIEGAPWRLRRIRFIRSLSVGPWIPEPLKAVLHLDELRQTVMAMIRASRSFPNLTTLDLDLYDDYDFPKDSTAREVLQRWISALLLGAPNLTSLTVKSDGVPWPPVLGLMSLRHLDITMRYGRPWLESMMTDLSLCSCLESLKFGDDLFDPNLPARDLCADIFLHNVPTLKSAELYNWYPKQDFTLPVGCMLRLAVVLETCAQWDQWQRRGCPLSMLCLVCMRLRAWPSGIQGMSQLQFLNLTCKRLQNQDLAALQHIPHVSLNLQKFSTFLLTSGAWQSLQVSGYTGNAGFSIAFSNVDAFVRGTKRFLFECSSQKARDMYRLLRAACMRQGVACHECEHANPHTARLSNKSLCRLPDSVPLNYHLQLVKTDAFWPERARYPELYRLQH